MGGRGSGGSRGGKSGAGGGGGASSQNDWAKSGTGQWDIDIEGKGGAQILEADMPYTRNQKYYEVHMWDKDYKILEMQKASSLTGAKSVVKNTLDIGKIK